MQHKCGRDGTLSTLALLGLGSEGLVFGVGGVPRKKGNEEDRSAQSNEDQPVDLVGRGMRWTTVCVLCSVTVRRDCHCKCLSGSPAQHVRIGRGKRASRAHPSLALYTGDLARHVYASRGRQQWDKSVTR